MGSSFGKIFSYIVSVFVLFIIIPYLFLSQLESTKETYIYSLTTDFADECMSTGQITPEKLEMYTQKVYGMGHYEVKMEHASKMAFSISIPHLHFLIPNESTYFISSNLFTFWIPFWIL